MKHQFEQLTEGAKKAVVSGVNRFVKANPEPQVIHLPNQDFMLRSGNQVFSSLTPDISPVVVSRNGFDLYDHGDAGYHISTVGIDPGSGVQFAPTAGIGFANHYGPNLVSPERVMELYRQIGAREGFEYAMSATPITHPEVLGRVAHALGEAGLPERWGRTWAGIREIDIQDGIKGAARNINFGDMARHANWNNYVIVPGGYPGEHIRHYTGGFPGAADDDRYGVLQAYMGGGVERINAYEAGKQIVSHPSQIIPDTTRYRDIVTMTDTPHRAVNPDTGKMENVDARNMISHLRWEGNRRVPTQILLQVRP